MAMGLLGQETDGVIDIHSGGEDNIFPHHECEIAQTCGATGEAHFARYWFHTRFLIVEGEKMSKSKGNFYTVRDVVAKGYSPAAIRLELIKTHYRMNANFTFQGLKDAQRQVGRWRKLADWLETNQAATAPFEGDGPLVQALDAFRVALADDLNLAGGIGALNTALGAYRLDEPPPVAPAGAEGTYQAELDALRAMDSVLGVLALEFETGDADVDVALVDVKIRERLAAREAKDWVTADRIRDELLAIGVAIKDGPDGTTWSRLID